MHYYCCKKYHNSWTQKNILLRTSQQTSKLAVTCHCWPWLVICYFFSPLLKFWCLHVYFFSYVYEWHFIWFLKVQMLLVTNNFFGQRWSWKSVVNYVTLYVTAHFVFLLGLWKPAFRGSFSVGKNVGIKLNTEFAAILIQWKIGLADLNWIVFC